MMNLVNNCNQHVYELSNHLEQLKFLIATNQTDDIVATRRQIAIIRKSIEHELLTKSNHEVKI